MIKELVINGALLKFYEEQIDKNRPTIIFLHDSLGCIELWRDFPAALGKATGCNVLVYDREGYGNSSPFTNEDRSNNYLELEADVLNDIIIKFEINEAILFGHSDGGSISLIAAAKYPGSITGVITEGAHVFVEDITLQGIEAAVEAYQTTNLKQRLGKYHGDKTDAVFNAWAKTWLTNDYRSWNIESFLPMIKCPLLIIQGENDEYGSIKQVDSIVNNTSGTADKFMIPAIGHSPHKEAKQAVLERSVLFINNLSAKQ